MQELQTKNARVASLIFSDKIIKNEEIIMHHLDPLNEHEIATACACLKKHMKNALIYFATVELY